MLFISFGLMLWTWGATLNLHAETAVYDNGVAVATATNFWAYRGAVASYVTTHPAASGTVADSSLTFPTGYSRDSLWTNTIQSGVLYTYSISGLKPQVADTIAAQGGRTMMIGVANAGSIMSSLSGGATGISIPSVVPVGAVVVVGN